MKIDLEGFEKIDQEIDRLENFYHTSTEKQFRQEDITWARIQGLLWAKRVLIKKGNSMEQN